MKTFAFTWGLAEATFFFFVPDVLLSFLGIRALRPALKASAAALAGAIIGGVAMYVWGSSAPADARAFLSRIPAISAPLLASVETQLGEQGLLALLLGPLRGTPYKIYAVECGARHGSLLGFLLVSIPARYTRFLLSVLVANAAGRWVLPARFQMAALAVFWVVLYSYYFWAFGL